MQFLPHASMTIDSIDDCPSNKCVCGKGSILYAILCLFFNELLVRHLSARFLEAGTSCHMFKILGSHSLQESLKALGETVIACKRVLG